MNAISERLILWFAFASFGLTILGCGGEDEEPDFALRRIKAD